MLRSILFSPADDQKKMKKAFTLGCDAVALDLEDAVAPSQKKIARELLKETLDNPPSIKIFVRINSVKSDDILDDLLAVVGLPLEGLMVAKIDSAEEVHKAHWLLGLIEEKKGLPRNSTPLIPFLENARGIMNAFEIARAPGVKALAFGGVDFSQSLGLRYPAESDGLQFARGQLVLASSNAGIEPPLDTVFPDIKNVEQLAEEAETARKLGFQGKLVIHPSQINPVNVIFTPKQEDVDDARKVVTAFEEAERFGSAVIQINGKMVEYPIYERAKEMLKRYDQ